MGETKTLDVPYPTPGEILKEEFLDPMGMTPYSLARGIFVDPSSVYRLIIQMQYDMQMYRVAERKKTNSYIEKIMQCKIV